MKGRMSLTMVGVALAVVSSRGADPGTPGWYDGPPKIEFLENACITADGGVYYLTGTAGTYDKSGKVDFNYNRGAPLWKSKDLQEWESLGYVFDRARLLNSTRGRPKIGYWLDWNAPAERIDALLAHATTTPKVYHINGDWFMLCAMNDQAVLLQKSATGRPDGPYEDFTVLATRGGYPSLFIDDDKTPYLVLADAWIAKVKPDLTALAENIRPLLPAPGTSIADNRLTLGERGVCLFNDGGTYYVFAPRWQTHDKRASYDAVLWTSDRVYGPYVETKTILRGTGPVTVFQSNEGGWKAVAGLPNDGPPRILDFTLP
jgi:beta-xylosidase